MPPSLTLEQVRNMLPCNKYRLDDELEVQADISERISAKCALMNSRSLEAKDAMGRVEGQLAEKARREDAGEKRGERMTVDAIASAVRAHPERIRAWQKYQEARAEHEEWLGVENAWRQKGFSLRALSDLYSGQYFALHATTSPERRVRDEGLDETRAAMRKMGSRYEPAPAKAAVPAPASGRRSLL